jgi:hypothetical protein
MSSLPPVDGSWVRFFGRRTGDPVVARWRKIGTVYEGHWQSPEGVRLPPFEWDRWEPAELPKKP